MYHIHPAIMLAAQIWGYIAATVLVVLIARRMFVALHKKIADSNEVIERAKYLPGGLHYDDDQVLIRGRWVPREELEHNA